MGLDLEVNVDVGPVPPLTVPLTSVDVTPFNGAGILMGWSLREASGDVPSDVSGSVVAPGAGATIATTPALAAGTYDVTWTVELQGAAAATDANNFELVNGAGVVLVSVNPGAAGVYQQPAVRIVVAAGATVSVKAVGAGTAGVTYTVDLAVTPNAFIGMQVEIQSGDTILGESSADFQESDTRWFGPQGIPVEQFVKLHVLNGTVTGCLYIQPIY